MAGVGAPMTSQDATAMIAAQKGAAPPPNPSTPNDRKDPTITAIELQNKVVHLFSRLIENAEQSDPLMIFYRGFREAMQGLRRSDNPTQVAATLIATLQPAPPPQMMPMGMGLPGGPGQAPTAGPPVMGGPVSPPVAPPQGGPPMQMGGPSLGG